MDRYGTPIDATEAFEVRRPAMWHSCEVCRKQLPPQLLIARFTRHRRGDHRWALDGWRCLEHGVPAGGVIVATEV